MMYYGLCETEFKSRYYNHLQSFKQWRLVTKIFGGAANLLPCQRLGGFAPQTPPHGSHIDIVTLATINHNFYLPIAQEVSSIIKAWSTLCVKS